MKTAQEMVMTTTQTASIEIVEVVLSGGNRGSRWIVKIDGKPVANYASRTRAERKAAGL